jgi:hypothetical protein
MMHQSFDPQDGMEFSQENPRLQRALDRHLSMMHDWNHSIQKIENHKIGKNKQS